MLVYLGVCAVLAFVGSVAALFLAVPPAPTFHIAFAAGALPLIFGAIIHFVPVLTRTGTPARVIHSLPLAVQLAGIATPLALGGLMPYWTLHPAASLVSVAAVMLALWTRRRLRATLGAPHPSARWYGAALLCLFFAVSLVPVWLALPELRSALRLFHLHLNTLGFIGLAALGTLPVLLPTALRQPDPAAAARLRGDLLPAVAGALLVAAGAAGAFWLTVPGTSLLGWVVVRDLAAWWRTYRMKVSAGGTAPLVVATGGFLLLLFAGLAHGAGWMAARPALAAYVALFLLPLVTGALAQLLPVWRHPGPDSAARQAMQRILVGGARWRAALFLAAGLLFLFDAPLAWLPAALALGGFVLRLGAALYNSRQTQSPLPLP
ncbi:MAG: hypothetical protein AB1642_05645 [Pseudomonadota bacterium]